MSIVLSVLLFGLGIECLLFYHRLYKCKYEDFKTIVMTMLLHVNAVSGRKMKESFKTQFNKPINSVEFYTKMARMEDEGLVECWIESKDIDGIEIKETWFRLNA